MVAKFDATDVAMYIFWHHNLDKDSVEGAVKAFYDDATVDIEMTSVSNVANFILSTPKYWP